MAACENPVQGLQKAAVCSICLEYFKDPVSIECGHNFCRACITQCCDESRRHFCCPHCRRRACKRDFRPNRELASMVELAKRFKLQEEVESGGGKGGCEKHQEPLKLFCDDDQSLICVVCDRSKEHRSHTVLPLEEAAQDYKEQIQSQLQTRKQERERLQDLKQASERTVEEYLNVKKILNRSKKEELHLPMEISQDLKEKLSSFDKKNFSLEKYLKKFKDSLMSELQEKDEAASLTIGVQTDQEFLCWQKDEILPNGVSTPNPQPVENMTLDLATAGPYVIVSDNGKSVTLGDTRQKRAKSRDQFNVYPCVLGSKGFSSGKHCWEVEVLEGGCWAVGVARESVKRKKKLNFRPEEGIWALEHLGFNHYRALTSPPTSLPLSKMHQKIQVCLDYEAGQVAFFDAEKDTWIFTFPSTSFGGEIIYPWLWVGLRSQLRLCP
ncbi:zinc finger protein RFP-like isoform X1 [Eublepharis macularius]|uniref:RING-type E3 ubiquitin transferase n=1 Tax=Eublepharis macularius TaxID=481883 RepID=A0AA97JA48_EUBMA|nr:zinc finger protein RFP-like isoform X1 [Eublepharis macularius]